MYCSSDGNGGLNISKPFAAVSILIAVITIIASSGLSYGALTERVDNLEEDVELITTIEHRIDAIEQTTVGTNIRVQRIQEDISEIKEALK